MSAGTGTRTAAVLAGIGVLTVLVGLAVEELGGGLGAPLAPFFAHWDPRVDGPALIWLPLFGLGLALAVALLRPSVPAVAFLTGALVVALLLRLAITAARDGVDGWYSVFGLDPEAANEYLPVLPALDSLGVRAFLDRFAELAPTLPIHPSAHPPGTLLTMEALSVDDPRSMAALVIVTGALTVPLTWWLGRRAGLTESRARAASLLVVASPAAMLYGVASTDAMFASIGTLAICLLLGGGVASRIAGTAAVAIASFFSWALLAAGAFAAIFVALRRSVGQAAVLAAGCAIAVGVLYAALHAATGFDPVGAIRSAGEAYDLGIASARPYPFWLFGSPVAFAVALGLPTTWYALRALGSGDAVAIGLAAIVLVAVLLGFTKAETERIWLFMGPLAAVAAASLVPLRWMPLMLVLLAAQAAAAELLLETVW